MKRRQFIARAAAGAAALSMPGALAGRANAVAQGLVVSDAEIAALPASGAAWVAMKAVADAPAGTANLGNQDNFHAPKLLAKALVWKRIGGASYRQQVEDGIRAAIGTEENSSPDQQLLAMSRQIGCYVVCADLIGLNGTLNSTAPGHTGYTWNSWLATIRTKNVGTHGAWTNLTQCHGDTDNNWGTFCGSSRIAVSRYLGDTADTNAAALIHRRWLGDRTAGPQFPRPSITSDSWDPSYVSLESGIPQSTEAQKYANRVAVNPNAPVGGIKYNGIVVMDLARSAGAYNGNYGGFDSTGIGYVWGVLQGVALSTLILSRGTHVAAWGWSAQSVKRAVAWLDRAGQNPPPGGSDNGNHVPHMVDHFNGTALANAPAGYGRSFGYTDWLYG